ncbi:MAG: energy-coupling factor transporter ATPase [Clostridia bacterium]|nr:energy-coupling factor transporter ATPase [Clostridia bacterium]
MISCRDVSFRYDTDSGEEEQKAVKNVTVDIQRGSFVVILGRNGSGKSTLAKLMNGVLIPQSGFVTVAGYRTDEEENLFPIRRHVGMVFQNPDNQLVSNVVEEDVAFGPENLGIEPSEIRKRVDRALETVGMKAFASHSPHKLSGGQKQRVAIAGILAMKPECIIFDESTAMLDPRGRREIMDTILRLNRNENITVVLITHHMEEAVMASRVIVMEDGSIVRDGDPKTIFSDVPFLHEAGLDAPQVTELIHLLSEDPVLSERFSFPKGILDEEEAARFILKLFGKELYGRNQIGARLV